MRLPSDAPPDTLQTLRGLMEEVEKLRRVAQDLQGRRIGGAGHPVQARDYVTKAWVEDLIERELRGVRTALTARPSVVTGTAEPPEPPSGCPQTRRAMDIGYYRVLGPGGRGNLIPEVRAHTNLVFVDTYGDFPSEATPSDRLAGIRQMMEQVGGAGMQAMLAMSVDYNGALITQGAILQAVRDSGQAARVKYIDLEDEPSWTTARVNQEVANFRNRWNNVFGGSLPVPPIGITTTTTQGTQPHVRDGNLDFVNIEAYNNSCACAAACCCGADRDASVNEVLAALNAAAGNIPPQKFLTVVMQAYNRNGTFCPVDPNLVAVNAATYLWANDNQRVRAITMFAWDRGTTAFPVGSRFWPALQTEHRRIWSCIGGATGGGGGGTGAKKCRDRSDCSGYAAEPADCCGGVGNPCNCPRLCAGGVYEEDVLDAENVIIARHPELFSGVDTFIDEASAHEFVRLVAEEMSTSPTIEAIRDSNDLKQVLVRLRVEATFREDYSIVTSWLTVRYPRPGQSGTDAYRATCWPATW
jgi:hypothetical protein